MSARLASGLWVAAYLARLRLADIPAYLTARGDEAAGAVVVKCATLDGQARAMQRVYDFEQDRRIWVPLANGAEADVDATIARARRSDPDLWVIEIEERTGRDLLDQDGLRE